MQQSHVGLRLRLAREWQKQRWRERARRGRVDCGWGKESGRGISERWTSERRPVQRRRGAQPMKPRGVPLLMDEKNATVGDTVIARGLRLAGGQLYRGGNFTGWAYSTRSPSRQVTQDEAEKADKGGGEVAQDQIIGAGDTKDLHERWNEAATRAEDEQGGSEEVVLANK
ncbi:hypothetical protein FKP32DRAFT_154438 [Trametes sanguinea]|nr:hypothetical protein FKP32DRAFT_154438 [Trametes sanguinea]